MFVLFTLLTIIAVATGGLALYFWVVSWRSAAFWRKRRFDTLPSGVRPHILKAMYHQYLQHVIDAQVYQHVKHVARKPYVGMNEFAQPILFVTDLDLARQVLIKDFDVFINRRKFGALESTDPMFYKMIFFMEGEQWRELRGKMSPTFTTGKIRRMFEIFNTNCTELVKYLRHQAEENDSVADFRDAYERYTMGVISSAAFGVDAKTFEKENSIFQKMGKKMQLEINPVLMIKFVLMFAAPKIAEALNISFGLEESEYFFSKVIKDVIRHREKTGDTRDDFLQLMLEARNGQLKAVDESELSVFEKEAGLTVTATAGRGKDSRVALTELTDDVIIAQAILFILAGFDTTQTLLLFAVYELTLNPDIQQRLSDEIEGALRKNGGSFSYDIINQLEYLEGVVNETLRKYPPVPRLERRSAADFKIPDTELVIPKETLIAIPTYSIHHDEEHFPNPDRFDPDRFSNEVKASRHPYAFQPFGHGPRNCVGMRFALTNAKMAIANIVHNFVLEPCAKTLIPMKFSRHTSLKPESMFLKLTPRK